MPDHHAVGTAGPDMDPDRSDRKKESRSTRKWTPEEDSLLKNAIDIHGAQHWRAISLHVGTRNHHQCRQRWRQVLSPGLCKGPWSTEEDALLVHLYYQGFRNWGEVAEKVEGRNAKQCRERWLNHLDPRLKKDEWTRHEDRILMELQGRVGNQWSTIAESLPGRSVEAVKNRFNCLRQVTLGKRKVTVDPDDPGRSIKHKTKDSRLQPAVAREIILARSGEPAFPL